MYIYNIFYSAGPHCFYFLFILSNPIIHSLSFSLSLVHLSFLSCSTLSMLPPSSSSLRYGTTCFFFFFFFFFFILSNPVSFTLSRSPSSLISSLSSSLSQRRRPDHRIRHRHHQVQTHAADLPQTHFSSADPLQVSCLCLLHVMFWVFDLGITSSSADPPIHFGFLIWIHFMWMSLFFIFYCCSGLLAW